MMGVGSIAVIVSAAALGASAKPSAVGAGVKLSPTNSAYSTYQALSKKVDAVVVIPTDIQGGVALIQKFINKGIPVINVGTEAATDKAYMIMQDDYLMGKLSADELVKKLGKNAGPGIIIGGPAN